MTLKPEHQHALLGAQIEAKPKADDARESIRAKYRPAVDGLRGRAADPEEDATDEQAQEINRRVNELADKTQRIILIEAALSVPECDVCEVLLDRLEVRCRHNVPLAQWINQTIEEQLRADYRELLDRGLDRLRSEVAALTADLDTLPAPEETTDNA